MNQASNYDATIKDVFQRYLPTLLVELAGGCAPVEFLNAEIPLVRERSVDLLVRCANGTLLHLEFQSHNHPEMEYRMAEYYLAVARKYKQPVDSVLVYIGSDPIRMKSTLSLVAMEFTYRIIDIRDLSTDRLFSSGNIGDLILSVLTLPDADAEVRAEQLVVRLAGVPSADKYRAVLGVSILGRLRGFKSWVYTKLDAMSLLFSPEAVEDLDDFFREIAVRSQSVTILRKLLVARFGALPVWVEPRLRQADPETLERWTIGTLTAPSLESLLG